MPMLARLGDPVLCPACAHGCSACPHPVSGTITACSSDTLGNFMGVARLGDTGVHGGCCGPNTFEVATGSSGVFDNHLPVARVGDMTRHCGGVGTITSGSSNIFAGELGTVNAKQWTPLAIQHHGEMESACSACNALYGRQTLPEAVADYMTDEAMTPHMQTGIDALLAFNRAQSPAAAAPPADHDEEFILARAVDHDPLPQYRFALTLPDGQTEQCRTNAKSRSGIYTSPSRSKLAIGEIVLNA